MLWIRRRVRAAASGFLVTGIYAYRATLGRFMGGHCRFHPTCSQYALDAIRKHGPFKGAGKAVWRILRCNPWGGSGVDEA